MFCGTIKHSNNLHNVWIWLISGIGVIFLNLYLTASCRVGMYLSNKIVKLAFSTCPSLVSIQLVTKGFQPEIMSENWNYGILTSFKAKLHSLISIRQNNNFDMLVMIWHEIICWFLKTYQDLKRFVAQEHRIVFVLTFRCAKQFYVPNHARTVKSG